MYCHIHIDSTQTKFTLPIASKQIYHKLYIINACLVTDSLTNKHYLLSIPRLFIHETLSSVTSLNVLPFFEGPNSQYNYLMESEGHNHIEENYEFTVLDSSSGDKTTDNVIIDLLVKFI